MGRATAAGRSTTPGGRSGIQVRLVRGRATPAEARFEATFTVGRSPECDVQCPEPFVSRQHLRVAFDGQGWWVRDLDTGSGTLVGGQRIAEVALTGPLEVELGEGGPVLALAPERVGPTRAASVPGFASETQIIERYLEPSQGGPAGRQTLMFRRAFARVQARSSRRYRWAIAAALGVLLLAGGVILVQARRIEAMKQTAEQLFYSMKALELQAGQLEELARLRGDAAQLAALGERQARVAQLQRQYDGFVQDLGTYGKLSEEDRIILRVARTFGECEVAAPTGFVAEVRRFMQRWRASGRMARALRRAGQQGYGPVIAKAFGEAGLSPLYAYVALQESDYDERALGPPTAFGVAKGMWQFIPKTAERYGLRTGPLQGERLFDAADERFEWRKATVAAARYFKDLTTLETQGSGLLAIASYNYGEDRLHRILETLPPSPEARNFWRLLADKRVPQETYDYVLSIVAAAAICQAPGRFGVEVECPIPPLPEPAR